MDLALLTIAALPSLKFVTNELKHVEGAKNGQRIGEVWTKHGQFWIFYGSENMQHAIAYYMGDQVYASALF